MLRFDIAAGNPLRLNGELIKKEPAGAEGISRKKNQVSVSSYGRLYTTLSKRTSFLLRTPWRCIPRSAEGATIEVSLNRIGLSAGRLLYL